METSSQVTIQTGTACCTNCRTTSWFSWWFLLFTNASPTVTGKTQWRLTTRLPSWARDRATPGATGTADGSPWTSQSDRSLAGTDHSFRGPVQQHLDGEGPALFGLGRQELGDGDLRSFDAVAGLFNRERGRRVLPGQHPLVMGSEKGLGEIADGFGVAGSVRAVMARPVSGRRPRNRKPATVTASVSPAYPGRATRHTC